MPVLKALKKLIKKLGKEFGPWSMLAVLLLENVKQLRGIGARVVAWILATSLVSTGTARVSEVISSAATRLSSLSSSVGDTLRERRTWAFLWHAVCVVFGAVLLQTVVLSVLRQTVVFPAAAASHFVHLAFYGLTFHYGTLAPQPFGRLAKAASLALSNGLTASTVKFALHLKLARFCRRRWFQQVHAAAVSEDPGLSAASSSGSLDNWSIPVQYEVPSSRGTDALHACMPILKRRRSLLRRRACPPHCSRRQRLWGRTCMVGWELVDSGKIRSLPPVPDDRRQVQGTSVT